MYLVIKYGIDKYSLSLAKLIRTFIIALIYLCCIVNVYLAYDSIATYVEQNSMLEKRNELLIQKGLKFEKLEQELAVWKAQMLYDKYSKQLQGFLRNFERFKQENKKI